jgi:catechol 2,3-dioxygenase-like lactoylglutathione lyase family enzyme
LLNSITPFFIVDDLQTSLDLYCSKLGFEIRYKGDFRAFVGRDGVMVMFKHISAEIHPQPNSLRHEWARWDAYINTSDPDSLYAEFEVIDISGYVLCFGRSL